MNAHRVFLVRALTLLLAIAAASSVLSAAGEEVMLEDQAIYVAFDKVSGALTRLENKASHWVLERRPSLAASFRLLAPLPERRANFVFGEKQRASEVTKLSAHQVRIRWADLKSEHGGVLALGLTATISLTNGVLTFDATLQN